jgi:ATP-dependent Clp protease protease subunit
MGGTRGQASDIEIHAREILRLQDVLRSILVNSTGQTLDKIIHDTDRDFFMNAEAAKEYGVIDEILVSAETVKVPADSKDDRKDKDDDKAA